MTKVMIIDDEKQFARLLKMNLESTGRYEVLTETNPMNAVHAAKQFRPDIVLSDVMMPGRDGGEVVASIRALPGFGNVPVIFITAVLRKSESNREGTLKGGNVYLAKPVRTEDVIACIEKYAFACH